LNHALGSLSLGIACHLKSVVIVCVEGVTNVCLVPSANSFSEGCSGAESSGGPRLW